MDSEEDDRVYYDSEDYDDDKEEVEQLLESFGNHEVTENSAGRHENYKILKEEEIKKLQEEDISDVINVLSVSRDVACTLLCQHKWNPSSVYESWFKFNREKDESLPGINMVDSFASPDDEDDLYQSYVDSSSNRKWCPNLSCNLAIEFDESGVEIDSYDVTCDCGYKSCWRCGKEGHTPLDCATVAKWVHKNKTVGDNATRILEHTKPCPKCERPIQNEGREHVICGEPCGHEFCWRCRGPWESYWHWPCNRAAGSSESREQLEKYAHYYARWASNDELSKEALGEMYAARNEPQGERGFVAEAWEEIVECRRVLKWSYAYGYYLWESGSGRLGLFEHLQKEAESAVKTLQACVEVERRKVFRLYRDMNESRVKLDDLTWVTRKHLNNLVRALE